MAKEEIKIKKYSAQEIVLLNGYDSTISFVIMKKYSKKQLSKDDWKKLLIKAQVI